MNRLESILSLRWLAKFHSLRIGHRLKGVADMDDAKQQGMLALIKAVDSWRESYGVPLRSYAGKKIKWALIDWLRTLKLRRRALSLDRMMDPGEEDIQGWEPTDQSASPERLAINVSVWDSVCTLKPQEQRVLVCRAVEGMTLNEIAAVEHVSRDRIKSMLQISLRRLRRRML